MSNNTLTYREVMQAAVDSKLVMEPAQRMQWRRFDEFYSAAHGMHVIDVEESRAPLVILNGGTALIEGADDRRSEDRGRHRPAARAGVVMKDADAKLAKRIATMRAETERYVAKLIDEHMAEHYNEPAMLAGDGPEIERRRHFMQCVRASIEVESWPEWKRGAVRYSQKKI